MVAQSRRFEAAASAPRSAGAVSGEHLAATQTLAGLIGAGDEVPFVQVAGLRGGEGVSTIARSLVRSVSLGIGVGVQHVSFFESQDASDASRSPLLLVPAEGSGAEFEDGVRRTMLPAWVIRQIMSVGPRSVIGARSSDIRLIVIETPPLLTTVEGAAISGRVDGTIIVLEADRSTYAAAREAREAVERAGGRILGVVLNKRRYRVPRLIARPLGIPSSRLDSFRWVLVTALVAAALVATYLLLRGAGIDPIGDLLQVAPEAVTEPRAPVSGPAPTVEGEVLEGGARDGGN